MTEIRKKTMDQYELVRKSGATNMYNYYQVINIADQLGFYSLASLTRDEYGDLLMNFSSLMKKYNIKQ
jgi:hypothetical protein